MKKGFLFMCLALFSVVSFAQISSWNIKAGMNLSNFGGDPDMNAKVGLKFGGGFDYAVNQTFSIQPSLFFSTKGAKKSPVTANLAYLELPVMAAAHFNVADDKNIVLSAGPYLAYGIGGKTSIEEDGVTGSVDSFGDNRFKRFDAGLGLGVALELNKFIIGLEGQLGLTNIADGGDAKNQNFSIVLGYKF